VAPEQRLAAERGTQRGAVSVGWRDVADDRVDVKRVRSAPDPRNSFKNARLTCSTALSCTAASYKPWAALCDGASVDRLQEWIALSDGVLQ
jgi:hypothetical protein